MTEVHRSTTLAETESLAAQLVAGLVPGRNATVIGLSGDLGSGKTTFTQSIAKALGVTENVTSPTFVIEKIYSLKNPSTLTELNFEHLIHIDAYRLESSRELLNLGWHDIVLDPKNLILIEWPE